MRTALIMICLALPIAACGVDGEPERPTQAQSSQTTTPETGITITGRAEVGVSKRNW